MRVVQGRPVRGLYDDSLGYDAEEASQSARLIWLDATDRGPLPVSGAVRGTPVCWRCGGLRDEGRSECDECERR